MAEFEPEARLPIKDRIPLSTRTLTSLLRQFKDTQLAEDDSRVAAETQRSDLRNRLIPTNEFLTQEIPI